MSDPKFIKTKMFINNYMNSNYEFYISGQSYTGYSLGDVFSNIWINDTITPLSKNQKLSRLSRIKIN